MSQATEHRTRFVITLESDGRRNDQDAGRKLRALLHKLSTIYGVKVVSVAEGSEANVRS
jgi:hypothetical protein